MASFVKVSHGRVRAFVSYTRRGKKMRVSRTFDKKREAEDWAFENEIARNRGSDLSAQLSIFADFYEWWVRNVKAKDVKESTRVHYREYGKRVRTLFGAYRLNQLNLALVQHLMDEYGETHSQKTVHEFLVVVKAAIRYAIAVGYMSAGDWTKLLKAHGRHVVKRNVALSIAEMKVLRSYCLAHVSEDEFCIFILLVLESGLRRGEVLGLRPNNLRMIDGNYFVCVRQSKSPHVDSLSLKTKQARRDVSIGQKVFNLVRSIPTKRDGFIFDEDGFHQSEMLRPILMELGLPHTTVHGLRDTNASFLFSQGFDMATMSNRLGHADIAITQKYYITLMPEKKHAQDGRAAELFDLL